MSQLCLRLGREAIVSTENDTFIIFIFEKTFVSFRCSISDAYIFRPSATYCLSRYSKHAFPKALTKMMAMATAFMVVGENSHEPKKY